MGRRQRMRKRAGVVVLPTATATSGLEAYLQLAEPTTRHRGVHGAHPSYRILFPGGVLALAKPADEGGDGERRVRHEVAAWKVAQGLGWTDLVGTTVLRQMESGVAPSTATTFSVQVVWPAPIDNPDLSQLRDTDIWRAAAFDAVTVSTDRSHNWLGVPPDPPYQLALVDHGDAFATTSSRISSVFFSARQGQPLPDAIRQ